MHYQYFLKTVCILGLSLSLELDTSPAQASLDMSNLQANGAENFNPTLENLPPIVIPPTSQEDPKETITPVVDLESMKLETVQTNFSNEQDNYGQRNQFIETTAQFRMNNGEKLLIKTGTNSFVLPGVENIINVPLQIGLDGKIGVVKIQPMIGVDVFNRLPPALNLHLNAEVPIAPTVTLSVGIDKEPYKSNAKVLENQISSWRYGPSLYWQIDPKTSLFSTYHRGNYSDGNTEEQSFSRLERKVGQFSISANLFTWGYAQDMQQKSGYFSPPDFLIYSGELAWEGDIAKFLRCHLAASLGEQRVQGKMSSGNTYQVRCTAKISPNIEADLGYAYSNEQNRSMGASGYNSRAITGQLRVKL